uniref:Uncharacterized protein n=1 Tax=Arundo donax TaxID=35708 RepID=A0A0A8YD05_ARUDO
MQQMKADKSHTNKSQEL